MSPELRAFFSIMARNSLKSIVPLPRMKHVLYYTGGVVPFTGNTIAFRVWFVHAVSQSLIAGYTFDLV